MAKIQIRPADYVSREAKFQSTDLALAREYADAHPDTFDDQFITSLEKHFDHHKFLTDRQHYALTNIIEKFRMEQWRDEQ